MLVFLESHAGISNELKGVRSHLGTAQLHCMPEASQLLSKATATALTSPGYMQQTGKKENAQPKPR